jgi:hypothetical protein
MEVEPDRRDHERAVEIEQQAPPEETDADTAREALELELMDHDASEQGEHIGEHNP